jgi:hypothetical protein
MGKQIARFALSPISALVSLVDRNAGAFLFNAIATAAAFIPGAGPLISAGLQAVNAATGAYRFSRSGGGGGLPDLGRLSLSQVAAAPRKAVFGTTAMAADVRYIEPSGTNQEYVDAIIHLASHKITSLDEIRIDDKVAWTSGGGVTGDATGYLTVSVIPEGGAGAFHTVNAGTTWGSGQRLTGCASVKMRFKRSGNSKNVASPYQSGIPSRIVFVGKGMPVYDPRRDTTVGGSGPHRANDRTTWAFTDGGTDLGNNPALQALSWLLGWTIGGKVSVGLGLPAARLDLTAFAAAANICDESVTFTVGGARRRYDGAGLFSDTDDPAGVMQAFAAAVNGWWDDSTGKLGLFAAVNDLAGATFVLTTDDVLGPVQWDPFPEIAEQYNIVRGLSPDPALPANYQPTDYPEVKIASVDGIDRALQVNFGLVQDKSRAQLLAKQVLQRQQYRGVARLTAGVRGWQLLRGQAIKFTFAPLGWTEKLFRVEEWGLDPSGEVALTLREENTAIYAFSASDVAAVTPATPVTYSPLNEPNNLWRQPTARLEADTGLASDDFARTGGLNVDAIVASGAARDGDVITFESTLPGVPQILFGQGGNAATAGQNVRILAEGVTASGFTMVAKSQSVTVGSTITDGSSTSGGVGEPDRIINRTNSGAPFDGNFKFNFSVTVNDLAPGEPGTITVGIFVKRSGAWVQVGEASYNSTGAKSVTLAPGTVDFGAGSEFGVSNLYSEGSGTTISAFTSVVYILGTVTETSLTPAGASSIPWRAIL